MLGEKAVGVLISNSSSGSSVTGFAGSSRDWRFGRGEASTDLKDGLARPGLRILVGPPGTGAACRRPCLNPPCLARPTGIAPGICSRGGAGESLY